MLNGKGDNDSRFEELLLNDIGEEYYQCENARNECCEQNIVQVSTLADEIKTFPVRIKAAQSVLLFVCLIIIETSSFNLVGRKFLAWLLSIFLMIAVILLAIFIFKWKMPEVVVVLFNCSGAVMIGACSGIGMYSGFAHGNILIIIQGLLSVSVAFSYLIEVAYNIHNLKSLKF